MAKPQRAHWITDRALSPEDRTAEPSANGSSRRVGQSVKAPRGFELLKTPVRCANPDCPDTVAFVHRRTRVCLACSVRAGWQAKDLRATDTNTTRQYVTFVARHEGVDRETVVRRLLRQAKRERVTFGMAAERAYQALPRDAQAFGPTHVGAGDAEIAKRIAEAKRLRSEMDSLDATLFDHPEVDSRLPKAKGSAE